MTRKHTSVEEGGLLGAEGGSQPGEPQGRYLFDTFPGSRGSPGRENAPFTMNKSEEALLAISKALVAVEAELQLHRQGSGTVGTPAQLEGVAAHLRQMEQEISAGTITPRHLRNSGMGHMVIDSWPLGSTLVDAVLTAEQAYLKL